MTGDGMVWISAPNFGEKAEQHRHHRRRHEDQRRVDFGHRHHADIFGIGGDAAAAHGAGEHGRQPVTDERAAHVRVHAAPVIPATAFR
jgi:hypothetical protein